LIEHPSFVNWTLALSERNRAIWVVVYAAVFFIFCGWVWYKLMPTKAAILLVYLYAAVAALVVVAIAAS
jgi:hypothetical protein